MSDPGLPQATLKRPRRPSQAVSGASHGASRDISLFSRGQIPQPLMSAHGPELLFPTYGLAIRDVVEAGEVHSRLKAL